MTSKTIQRPQSNPYDCRFFESINDGSRRSAQVIAPIVMSMIQPRSILDIGCGEGAWLRAFADLGVDDYCGIDGPYVDVQRLQIDRNSFRPIDLKSRFMIDRKYDLAICLEVLEHLPDDAGRYLVTKLVEAAPFVLFSAAIPGQGGTDHINERWPIYWEQLFNELGYQRIDAIRRQIWQDNRVQWWYQQNVMLYADNVQIENSLILTNELARTQACRVELVSRDMLAPLTYGRAYLSLLPRVLANSLTRAIARKQKG